MGGSQSSFTAEQSALLTKKLKEKYENLIQSGETDTKIQDLLTEEYKTIVTSFVPQDNAPEPSNGSSKKVPIVPNGNSSRRNSRAEQNASSKNGSRRNSRTDSTTPRKDGESSSKHIVSVETVDLHAGRGSSKGSGKIGLSHSSSGKVGSHKGSSKIVGGARRRSYDHLPKRPGNGSVKSPRPPVHAGIAHSPDPKASDSSKKNSQPGSPAVVEPSPTEEESKKAETESAKTSVEQQADSWDSVSQQPYCNVCKMAFKSIPFLERHVKYSDLHARNAKKAEGVDDGESPFPVTQSGKLAPTQIEGKHYKLLYSGSKFFWRTQAQVDLNFYHHILPHTIEIISYDSVKSKEINRIYLDHMLLMDIITAFDKAHKPDPRDHAAPPQPTEEHEIISRFILARLQLNTPSINATSDTAPSENIGKTVMEFVKLSSDDYQTSPVLPKAPIILVPVSVSRRRRTSSDEINATMRSLDSDRAALVEATGNAQRVANLVYTSATGLAKKKWWSDFNPVRKRWVFAIRRVIRQKHVAETKMNLLEREKARMERDSASNGSSKRVGRTVSKEI